MITLNTTTRKLQAVLSGAVSTNQLPIVTSYADKTTSAYTGGANRTTTNNATQVDIVSAPAASTIREVDFISVFNKDTATRTVTILYDDNGTDAELITAVLLVGETLQYTHANGWKVLDSAGAVKTTANTVPTTSAALAAQITDETGSGALVFATSPTLVTPNLGTPSSLVLTNATGLPTAGINNDAVTYAKIQNVSATDRILGRSSAGAGDVEEITCTSAGRAILDDADASAQRTTLGLGTAAVKNAGQGIDDLTRAGLLGSAAFIDFDILPVSMYPEEDSATSRTLLVQDRGKMIFTTSGSAIAWTAPDVSSLPDRWMLRAKAAGAGAITITMAGSDTIDGAASLVISSGSSVWIIKTGTTTLRSA